MFGQSSIDCLADHFEKLLKLVVGKSKKGGIQIPMAPILGEIWKLVIRALGSVFHTSYYGMNDYTLLV